MAALGDKNVGGLDVAMNDAFDVRGVECVGNLNGQRQNRFRLHRMPVDAVLQRHAIQKLHGYEHIAVLVINLVNGADVRMIQS